MENTDNNYEVLIEEEGPDIKRIIYLLLRQWHWFLLFGALGLGGAYTYTRLTKASYSVSSSMLIPEKSKGMDMKDLFEGALINQNNTKINNQIEILKSSFTINQTLLNLNWRTSWFKKNLFLWNGIYRKEPFDVQEPQGFLNPAGIRIYITPTDQSSYTISVSGTMSRDGNITEVNFESQGEFGKPFRNEPFNFTLLKQVNKVEPSPDEFYFVFNDLKRNTLAYQKRLNATLKDEKSDIVLCTLVGEEPKKEGDFLNELVSVYIDQKMSIQNEALRRSLDFINRQLLGMSDSLDRAGTKFTEFRSKNDIIDLGTEGTMVMNNLKDIETEQAKSQVQLDYFRNVLSYLEESGDLTKIVSPSVVGIEDASLNMLVIKLGELFNRRQILSFTAKPNNPTLLLLDRELMQTRTRLNENLRNLIGNATKSINSLKDRQSRISIQLNKLPRKEQQMINIQRQFTLTNEIYTFLLQKQAETNISLASSISDVQIIEIASPETATRIGLNNKMIFPIGFILGLSLPAIFILLINFFDDRIRTQEDVENNTQLPILGNIMHRLSKIELTVFEDQKSSLAEAFRDLRTNLEFMLPGEGPKIISIHSTNPDEGKSFTTTNLAIILAMNDNKVLIIGADLRNPKLHKTFNVENNKGLSTYLIGYDKFEETVCSTQIENLDIMPSGPIPPNPAEILSKPAMKILIETASSKYDYIILDNAPVALVTDGIIISRLSDLNIFILRYGFSHKHQLEMINQYAATKKVSNVAIIVNDIKDNAFGNSYYKYSKYEAYKKLYYADDNKEPKNLRKKKVKKG
ncbi:MAG TPA: polysaccharide biosynthesis tyrosine autokinase [Prolixibacteraceae bacterium]|nr:polysaccharide biosynthesis tyrosine autokinase [Prolixibacteraceae bacterium]